jgi:hypothetical protein
MNRAQNNHAPLPRYGIRDDEKTRPCVVLFDWNGDDEAPVHVRPLETSVRAPFGPPHADLDDDDIDVNLFRPRWRGVGRRPGAVALALVLGVSVTIGAFALFGAGEAQAEAATSAQH